MIKNYVVKRADQSWLTHAVLFFIVLLINCGCSEQPNNQSFVDEQRPDNVPQEAFRVGGIDGGVYVVIKHAEEEASGVFSIEIYYEDSGDLWYQGRASLQANTGSVLDIADQQIFEGWDGENLYLRDGRYLKAIDPFDIE